MRLQHVTRIRMGIVRTDELIDLQARVRRRQVLLYMLFLVVLQCFTYLVTMGFLNVSLQMKQANGNSSSSELISYLVISAIKLYTLQESPSE